MNMQQLLTKTIWVFALLAVTLMPVNAQADVATQCSIDHAVNGAVQFKQCPISDENNDILTAGFDGVRLDASADKSKTPVWAFNTCRYVDNASASALFVPLKSVQEWLAFIANPPAKVSFAGCCEPRPMRVSDIPTPPSSENCAAGWVLKGLVDTSDHKKLVATPDTQAPASLFTLVPGVKDDATYPISKLPIGRDDIGAVLPDNANPGKTYAAKFSCGSNKDYYIDFHMQCRATEWVSDNIPATTATTGVETITPVAETTTGSRQTTDVIATDTIVEDDAQATKQTSANCQLSVMRTYSKKCSNGAPGFTAYRQVFNSCTKQIENQIIANTCAGISGGINGCVASTNTSTVSCPNGQSGSITTRTEHICDGSNGGAGRDSSTIVSNTCTPGGGTGGGTTGCVPVNTLTTTPCSDPSVGGIITLRRIRVCDGSNGGAGSTTETVVSNTCTASGCVNSIMLKTSTVCQGGTLVRAKVYNSCTKQITDTVISNTCR